MDAAIAKLQELKVALDAKQKVGRQGKQHAMRLSSSGIQSGFLVLRRCECRVRRMQEREGRER